MATTPSKKLLLPHHRKQLQESGLSDQTIESAGFYSETNADKIRSMIKCTKRTATKLGAVLVIPFIDLDGRNGYSRIRPDNPRQFAGRKLKYESPKGEPNQVYIPPDTRDWLATAGELLITEGEKKALAATQAGFPTIGLVGVHGWKQKAEQALLPTLERIEWNKRRVIVAFDSDIGTNEHIQHAEKWLCHHLTLRGADVKVIRFADADDGSKVGLDDFLVAQGPSELRKLCDTPIDPDEIEGEVAKRPARTADPAIEAKRMVDSMTIDGCSKLRFWSGSFWYWSGGRYYELPNSEVRASIVSHLNYSYTMVGTSEVSNTMEQLRAQSLLPARVQPPSWLRANDWRPEDVVATKNAIVHLPSYVTETEPFTAPSTPTFFTTCSVDYEFDHTRPPCERWMQFISELWPDDQESVQLLQEWFGYCLTPDTSQQKIAMLIGPKRSGKGTIARVLRSLVGDGNVCGPTLASLQTNFGLWPLLGKTVAIISDARLSGRSDQAVITERLLSISGEDAQTVDRKNLEPITTKLQTRFMIISNELPRLQDSSGAFAGRMVVLRLSESFYGREDRTLTQALEQERAGILHWAIEGWRRLRERGRFVQPASGEELRQQLDELSSPISSFVADCCEVGSGFNVQIDTIYGAWCRWCKSVGRDPTTKPVMGRDLTALIPGLRTTQPREDGKRVRAYDGIRVNEETLNALAQEELARDGTRCGTR